MGKRRITACHIYVENACNRYQHLTPNIVFVISGNYKLHWEEGPRTILIIKKPNDDLTDKALVDVASYVEIKDFFLYGRFVS